MTKLLKQKKGQGLVEYGILMTLVVAAVIAGTSILGGATNGMIDRLSTTLTTDLDMAGVATPGGGGEIPDATAPEVPVEPPPY